MSTRLDQQYAMLRQGEHLCSVYGSTEEMLAQVVPYLKQGLLNGEHCVYVADEHKSETIFDALGREGMDAQPELTSGRLCFWTRQEYRQPRAFDLDVMRRFIEDTATLAGRRGYAGVRLAVEMSWTTNSGISEEDLVRWEGLLNQLSYPGSRVSFICQYNARLLPAHLIAKAVRVHPVVVVGQDVCANIHYGAAEEALRLDGASLDILLQDILSQRDARALGSEWSNVNVRLLDMLPVAVYICDAPSGVIRYYNRRAVELWKREPQWYESEHRFCGAFRLHYHGAIVPPDACPMAIAVREGASFGNVEAQFERPDGSIIDVLVNIEPIKDGAGRVVGVINVFQDITQMKLHERKIDELNRQLHEKIAELETFADAVVGRELRMMELEGEMRRLQDQLGHQSQVEQDRQRPKPLVCD